MCEVVPPGAGPTSVPTHRMEVVVCSRQGIMASPSVEAGELWWNPFQGSHGTAYLSIDGQESVCPIAECDNTSMVLDALHTMCRPSRASRLAVLPVIFGLATAHHYNRHYGG